MSRMFASTIALCLTIVLTGCKASSDTPKATVAKGGMMPIGEVTPEIIYVVDQAEVKLVPERTFSTEPLSTFRAKLDEKRTTASAKSTSGESGAAKSGAASGEPKQKSMWGSFVSLIGGKPGKSATAATESPDAADSGDTSTDAGSDDGASDDGEKSGDDDSDNDDDW